jgi:hypothetical protein
MSKTTKDLKSHKKGFGKFKSGKPRRKLTPLSRDADKITGKRHELVWIENDLKQEDFQIHWSNAKTVRALRKQLKAERGNEKSSSRSRMKRDLKKQLKGLK